MKTLAVIIALIASVSVAAPTKDIVWTPSTHWEDDALITNTVIYQVATGLPGQTNIVDEGTDLAATVAIWNGVLNQYWVRACVPGHNLPSLWSEPYVNDQRRPKPPGKPK